MLETQTAHYHLDYPGPGQRLKANEDVIRGWLVPKPEWHYTDVRLSFQNGCFAGIHGFPRPDLAAYFRSDRPYLLAEFAVPVCLPAGRTELTLEGCTSAGVWEKIGTFEVEAEGSGSHMAHAPVAPFRACEAGAAMRHLLRILGAEEHPPIDLAVTDLLDAAPLPHVLRYPHQPFHGHLDEPWCWTQTVFGRLTVIGCLFHETQPIRRILATTDIQALQALKCGRPSPRFAAQHPDFSLARNCGFEGVIDVPSQLPQPFTLRIYAELDDGSLHLGSVVRVTADDQEFAKRPLARYSPFLFLRVWRRLRDAALARGRIFEGGAELRGVLFDAWRQYRVQAPRRSAPMLLSRRQAAPGEAGSLSRMHLVTHNLNREGAPLFLLEYARQVKQETGCQLAVTSACEGTLRRDFEALGASVQVVETAPLLKASGAGELRTAIRGLVDVITPHSANLVVVNTLAAYWGVALAQTAGCPVLLYIHESTSPSAFFHGHMPAATLPVVAESFRRADAVSFLTVSTRRYYTGLGDGSNFLINPGWIDLAAIDGHLRGQDRLGARAELGISPERMLVVNIGTVCDRKGQHVFARAVDLLWRQSPELAARCDFLMIGGRDTSYDRALGEFLVQLGRENLRVVPETQRVQPYYAAAGLFVCSSYEESFPRVLMEAMAFRLPIVSSNVHGVPEIARQGQEALLVPPGDTHALAAAMRRLLSDPEKSGRLALAARARVEAEFDIKIVLPRHVALARSLAARQG